MAFYEYVNCEGLVTPGGEVLPEGAMVFELFRPMYKAEPVGTEIDCPAEGFEGKLRRVFSVQNIIVAGQVTFNWDQNTVVHTKDRDGQDIKFSFVDHKHTSPEYQRNLSRLAKGNVQDKMGMSNARYDPKHGRMVVDVVSNVADPLGKIERDKRERGIEPEKKPVQAPVKKREVKPAKELKPTDVPLPRRTQGGKP